MIAEADRHLSEQRARPNSADFSHASAQQLEQPKSVLDWSDDEVFDELLAAVPDTKPPVTPNKHAIFDQKPVEESDLSAVQSKLGMRPQANLTMKMVMHFGMIWMHH